MGTEDMKVAGDGVTSRRRAVGSAVRFNGGSIAGVSGIQRQELAVQRHTQRKSNERKNMQT